MEIQENLNNIVDEHNQVSDKDSAPIVLTNDSITEILVDSGIPEEISTRIEKCYNEEFKDTPPVIEHLLDKKVLEKNEQRKKEERLKKKVEVLQSELEKRKQESKLTSENTDTNNDINSVIENSDEILDEQDNSTNENINSDENEDINSEIALSTDNTSDYDIVLNVKPQKISQIKSEIIDGKKCLIIPVDDNEQAKVNGVDTIL